MAGRNTSCENFFCCVWISRQTLNVMADFQLTSDLLLFGGGAPKAIDLPLRYTNALDCCFARRSDCIA